MLQQLQLVLYQILRWHPSTRFGNFTDYKDISPLTVVHNLLPSSRRSSTASSISTNALLLRTSLRIIDSVNELSAHTRSTCAATAITGKNAGEHTYLLANSLTTPYLPPFMVTRPTKACMTASHKQYTSITTTNWSHERWRHG